MASFRFQRAVLAGCLALIAAAVAGGCGNGDANELNPVLSDDVAPDEAIGGMGGSTDPPRCEEDATLPHQDAAALFDYDHVPTFEVFLPEADWEELLSSAVDEQWTLVDACFEGKSIGTIQLRFKGSYGTLYSCFNDAGELTCPRLSMKMKFSGYDEDLRFFGLKRLNLHSNRYDDSMMKERLAYDLYRSMGVTAPRASWAVVRVNGQSLGLYGMVEELDGRFTEDRWPDYPDGNLYKELWPTDTDQSDIIDALRTNEDEGDVSGFAEFSQAIEAADGDAEALEVLGEFTDLDTWARYMAVDDAVLSYDRVTYFFTDAGITYNHNHNYYFYEDAPSHFELVPWDVESTFWINPAHAAPHWTEPQDDCSATYPYWEGLAIAPGCDPIFRALRLDLERWGAAARELLDGPFSEEEMLAAIDAHAAFMGEHARSADTPTAYGTFDSAVDGLRRSIVPLRRRLEDLVAASEAQ